GRFFRLPKNLHRTDNQIGRGGVYGATASILMEGNPISRKKNRFLADFTAGIRRIQVKSVGGGCGGGKVPPSTSLSKYFFDRLKKRLCGRFLRVVICSVPSFQRIPQDTSR
ncbi:MAG: hypothetical protein IJD60_03405, partial [Clostridia bacterium]|nr:hypothetical protein [Clostridia bacterium]